MMTVAIANVQCSSGFAAEFEYQQAHPLSRNRCNPRIGNYFHFLAMKSASADDTRRCSLPGNANCRGGDHIVTGINDEGGIVLLDHRRRCVVQRRNNCDRHARFKFLDDR